MHFLTEFPWRQETVTLYLLQRYPVYCVWIFKILFYYSTFYVFLFIRHIYLHGCCNTGCWEWQVHRSDLEHKTLTAQHSFATSLHRILLEKTFSTIKCISLPRIFGDRKFELHISNSVLILKLRFILKLYFYFSVSFFNINWLFYMHFAKCISLKHWENSDERKSLLE